MKKNRILVLLTLLLCQLGLAQERPQLVLQRGHEGSSEIRSVAPSPDGRFAYTASSDGTVKVWALDESHVVRTIYDEKTYPNPDDIGELQAAAFSPRSDWVVTLDEKGNFRRYSLPDGKLLGGFTDPDATDTDTALTSDGVHLYYLTRESLIKADFDGKKLASVADDEFSHNNGRFVVSPDGRLLAVKSQGGVSTFLTSDLSKAAYKRLNSVAYGLAFSPASDTLAVSTNSAVALLSAQDLEVQKLIEDQASTSRVPTWRNSELYLYQTSGGYTGKLWRADFETSKIVEATSEELIALSIARMPDSRFLVGAYGGDSFVLDPATGERDFLSSDIGGFSAYTLDPESKDLFTGCRNGQVSRWSAKTGRIIRQYKGFDSFISDVALSPDRTKLLAADLYRGTIICWNVEDGEVVSTYKLGRSRFGDGVEWVKWVDSNRYLFAAPSTEMKLVDASTAQVLNEYPGRGTSSAVKGDRLAAGFYGGLMEAHLTNKRDVLRTSLPGRSQVSSVAYGPDGKTVYAATRDSRIFKWDSSSPENKPQLVTDLRWSLINFELLGSEMRVVISPGTIVRLDLNGKELSRMELADKHSWSPRFEDNVIILIGRNRTLDFIDPASGQRKGRLVSVRDNEGWVAMDKTGNFDGNDVGLKTINFELNGELFGVDQFINQYLSPGILAHLLPEATGEKPPIHARTSLTAETLKRPPKVEILEPASGAVVDKESLEVKVKVTPQGAGVSGVALYHNGHKLPDSRRRKVDDSTYLFSVKAMKGKNELRASAFDESGNVESRRDRVRVLAPNIEARPPRLHLLSVGVDKYSSGLSLKFAEDDARSVSELFRSELYEAGERKFLKNEEATLAGITGALKAIAAVAEPQDAFVFYLAGHGTVVGDEYYFLPHDVKIETDQALAGSAMSSSDLAGALSSVPATKQLLVLDSCRSGKAVGVVSRYFSSRGGLEEIRSQQMLSRTSGTFLIAATKGEEYAYEISQLGHGVLTYALLDSLGLAEGKASQGEVTANDLLRAVSTKVPDLSEKYHGVRQQVIQYSSGQDFPLVK